MIYGIMALHNQNTDILKRTFDSIQVAYDNMQTKNFTLIIYRDDDKSVLPNIPFPNIILESINNVHQFYARLKCLEIMDDDDYWFDIDSDDELSKNYLTEIEDNLDKSYDIMTGNVLTDNSSILRLNTLIDILANTWLHGCCFKRSLLSEDDFNFLLEINKKLNYLCFDEDLILLTPMITNITSFKPLKSIYIYHDAIWKDKEKVRKKYAGVEVVKSLNAFTLLLNKYQKTVRFLFLLRENIKQDFLSNKKVFPIIMDTISHNNKKLSIENMLTIEEINSLPRGAGLLNNLNIDSPSENDLLVLPIIEVDTNIVSKILYLINDIIYCCYNSLNFEIVPRVNTVKGTYLGKDWFSHFFTSETESRLKLFVSENKLDLYPDVFTPEAHSIANKIFNNLFFPNDSIKNAYPNKHIDYDNTTAIIIGDLLLDSIYSYKYSEDLDNILENLSIDTPNVLLISKSSDIIDTLSKRFSDINRVIVYPSTRTRTLQEYSHLSMNDSDFIRTQNQLLHQLFQASKCKKIKSTFCEDGILTSIITNNEFEYI